MACIAILKVIVIFGLLINIYCVTIYFVLLLLTFKLFLDWWYLFFLAWSILVSMNSLQKEFWSVSVLTVRYYIKTSDCERERERTNRCVLVSFHTNLTKNFLFLKYSPFVRDIIGIWKQDKRIVKENHKDIIMSLEVVFDIWE